jgi:hypothetical protein
VRQLGAEDRFLPGFGVGHELKIEVCGPVRNELDGRPAMRWFDSVGKTKNGQSVILRIVH